MPDPSYLIQKNLAPDLLQPRYQKARTNSDNLSPCYGHCYVASESYYHLMGGKSSGLTPMWLKHEGSTHWFLRQGAKIIDLTAGQFSSPVPYEKGRGAGFLTKEPSKRAQKLLEKVKNELQNESQK